jgi:hypothetical protein
MHRTQLVLPSAGGHKTFGKGFAECHPRHSPLGLILDGKEIFADYFLSGTRQSVDPRQKKWYGQREHGEGGIAECQDDKHSAKVSFFLFKKFICRVPPHSAKMGGSLPSAFVIALGKAETLIGFLGFPESATLPSALALTLGKGCLCRVQHMAK